VNCKVLSIVDGNVQTKIDLAWESEPNCNGKAVCVCVRSRVRFVCVCSCVGFVCVCCVHVLCAYTHVCNVGVCILMCNYNAICWFIDFIMEGNLKYLSIFLNM